jgi:hypothetical protein
LIQLSPEETGDAPGTLYEALPPDSAGRVIYEPRGTVAGPEAPARVRAAPTRRVKAFRAPVTKTKSASRSERAAERRAERRAERSSRAAARRAARAAGKAEASSKGEARELEPDTTATVDPPLRRAPDPPPAVERPPVVIAPPPRRMIQGPPED